MVVSPSSVLQWFKGKISNLSLRSQYLQFKIGNQLQLLEISPVRDNRGLDLLLVLVVPESDFMVRIDANNSMTILLCVVALIVMTIFSVITARWISFPILHLSQATQAIAKGHFNQSVQSKTIKELKIMAHSFNSMIHKIYDYFNDLEQSREESDKLLLNILPRPIAEQLKRGEKTIATAQEEVTILFADVVGFTPLSAKVTPIQLVGLLNQLFSSFDYLSEQYKLEKIKTIGDAYMVVGGLPLPQDNHAEAIADMALEMQAVMDNFQAEAILGDLEGWEGFQIRIGINTGSVVAGVIGIKKFIYDLWGDAVNIASRMESSGKPGRIQVREATYERLKYQYYFEVRGEVSVKGRGKMKTYWLLSKKG